MSTRRRIFERHYRECSMAYLKERLRSVVQDESYELAAIIHEEIQFRKAEGKRTETVQTFQTEDAD
jgi:protein-arginine kinase activator protein McsA